MAFRRLTPASRRPWNAASSDDPALGLNVEGAEDEDFGLGRPNTQMSMQAETRFVGSQY